MIPTEESVSAEWFTQCLQDNGVPAQVVGFSGKPIGTGQIGKCIRYSLEYAPGAPASAPASLVLKLASDDPVSRATGMALNNFLREVRFYQQLQSRVSIRTPRCYFADIEGEGPEFALLLEDMAPAEQGDQLRGCSPAVAEAAVLEVAGLHAPTWCDDSLEHSGWLVTDQSEAPITTMDLYRSQLQPFLDYYGDRLQGDEREIIAAVAEATEGPLAAPDLSVFSLVHVDYRLDNILIDTDNRVTAVDWQSVTLGAPLNDVAYFMGAGLLPDIRPQVEEGIVRAYHRRLGELGVADFDFEDCWQAYRKGTFAGFAVTVIASCLVQHTDRGDEMFTAMARRHSRHAIDLGAAEFLR